MKHHLPMTIEQEPHRTPQRMDRRLARCTVSGCAVGCQNYPWPKGYCSKVGKRSASWKFRPKAVEDVVFAEDSPRAAELPEVISQQCVEPRRGLPYSGLKQFLFQRSEMRFD
jgi:hypothetical protein